MSKFNIILMLFFLLFGSCTCEYNYMTVNNGLSYSFNLDSSSNIKVKANLNMLRHFYVDMTIKFDNKTCDTLFFYGYKARILYIRDTVSRFVKIGQFSKTKRNILPMNVSEIHIVGFIEDSILRRNPILLKNCKLEVDLSQCVDDSPNLKLQKLVFIQKKRFFVWTGGLM